jgi:hypothetical protein
MPTLGELASRFDANVNGGSATEKTAADGGHTKIASEGGASMSQNESQSLTSIYLRMSSMDKTASAAATANGAAASGDEGTDFAKVAEELAAIEAQAQVDGDGDGTDTLEEGEGDIVKVAQEYDSAGRIMARGFYDEFMKLAAVHTQAHPNQMTESPSHAATPALGKRGLPTTETNFAGSAEHTEGMKANGGKENYKTSLTPKKKVHAGVTGDNPEAAAISVGGGSPVGFATIKDIMG